MFRQASRQPGFRDDYLHRITKVAARAAVALQGCKRADITLAVIVSSFLTRSRMMPSVAYNISIEMKIVLRKHFEGTPTAANNIWLGLLCQNAARAIFNVTNQLLFGKMHGRRPLLVLMGTNSHSSNWERFVEFVLDYHRQYGVLHIALRITVFERNRSDLQLLCPHPFS